LKALQMELGAGLEKMSCSNENDWLYAHMATPQLGREQASLGWDPNFAWE
jgi:hypothetical protein